MKTYSVFRKGILASVVMIFVLSFLLHSNNSAFATCPTNMNDPSIILDSTTSDGYVLGHGARFNITGTTRATNVLANATDQNCNLVTGSTPVSLSLTPDNSGNLYLNTYLMLTTSSSSSMDDPPHLNVGTSYGNYLIVQYTDNSGMKHYSGLYKIVNPDTPNFPPPAPIFDLSTGTYDPPYPDTSIIIPCKTGPQGGSSGDYICDDWKTSSGLSIPIINKGITTSYTWYCTDDPSVLTQHPTWDTPCPKTYHKDVYVQVDWMQQHGPSKSAMQSIINAYKNAGVYLHLQYANEIHHLTSITGPNNGADTTQYTAIKFAYFGNYTDRTYCGNYNVGTANCNQYIQNVLTAKRQVFHYVLFAHNQASNTESSGKAEYVGQSPFGAANDMLVSLGSFSYAVGSPDQQAGTFMHELGHNLGLDHGGPYAIATDSSVNCKPNYLSVMSYTRQFSDLFLSVGRPLDYSSDQKLLLWMKFQNDLSDSSSGTSSIGTINSGGTATFVPGQIGQAFNFDGKTSITVNNPNNFNFESTNAWSGGAWVYPTDDASGSEYIFDKRDSSTAGWGLFNYGKYGVEFFMVGNTVAEIRTATILPLNTWTHVFFTYDGSRTKDGIKIYFNGVPQTINLIGTFPTTSIKNSGNLLIGSRYTANFFMVGQLDEAQVYNMALSPSQVSSLYNGNLIPYQYSNIVTYDYTLNSSPITENPVTSTPSQYTVFVQSDGSLSQPTRADIPINWDWNQETSESSEASPEPTLSLIPSSFPVITKGVGTGTARILCPSTTATAFSTWNDWNNLLFNMTVSSSFADGAGAEPQSDTYLLWIVTALVILVIILAIWFVLKYNKHKKHRGG